MPVNDDINNLLGLIDEADKVSEVKPVGGTDPASVARAETSEALRPIDQPIKKLDAEPAPPSPKAEPGPVVDVGKMFEQMDAVTQNVLQCAKDDRNQAESAIMMINEAIEEAHNAGKPASKTYVEGLIKAIEVKANINTTVVKIMEANAKLFAATKSGLNLQINNQNSNSTVSSDELVELLNTPLDLENEP